MSERVEIGRRYQFPGAQGVLSVSDVQDFEATSDGTHFFRTGDSEVTVRPDWNVLFIDYAPEVEPEPEQLPIEELA